MATTAVVSQDIVNATQQVVISDPTEFDNILFNSSGITYASESAITISLSDLQLWYGYLRAFNTSLLANFPVTSSPFPIGGGGYAAIPICKFEIASVSTQTPNIVQYVQTSTLTSLNVYNITYSTTANTATFAARSSSVTISLQEYLIGFQFISTFINQCIVA